MKRHVLIPGAEKHRNTGTLRNTPEHSGKLRNTGTPRNTGTAEKPRNTEFDSVGLFSCYRPCKKMECQCNLFSPTACLPTQHERA